MNKKVNLTEFKNLVKRIIKEEKDNSKNKKTIRITESQLRNQVRKMLREYQGSDGYYREKDVELVFPDGEGVLYDWTGGFDINGEEESVWDIEKVVYYPDWNGSEEGYEINIEDPKYGYIKDEIDEQIDIFLDDEAGINPKWREQFKAQGLYKPKRTKN
jgi:hypothetical protein